MFRIRLPSGIEMMFPSPEDFQAAVSGGVVTSDSEIFHQKAERWVPIASHPTYHRAVSAAKAAAAVQATQTTAAPVRRVAPTAPAPRAAIGGSAVEAVIPQTSPRPAVAPAIPASAQRPRLVLEKPAPAASAPPVAISAQRPAIVIPEAPAPAVAEPEARPVLKVTPPPMPSAPPAPAPARSNELKLVEVGEMDEPVKPAAPIKASAPRPVVKAPAAPAVEAPAANNTLLDVGDEFEILEGFEAGSSAPTVELPTASPPKPAENAAHSHAAEPIRNSRPAPALPTHPAVEHAAHSHGAAHHEHHTPAPAKSGSGRWLIAAGLGAALIGGGALVAWRSGSGHPAAAQAAPAAPAAATSAYTPVQEAAAAQPAPAPQQTVTPPATQGQPAGKPAASPVVQPPVEHAPAPAPAVAAKPLAPAQDSSAPILPGRPQSMAVDIDVSGADVGTVGVGAAGAAGSGVSLGIVADHYADAAADAGKQLEARLGQIGFSRLLAPLRFGSVESMEGARRTISSAAGMVGAYRSRMVALDRAYSDSAARAQKGQKATPKEMLAWDHRLPQRETAEAAQAVDLALTKVDQLYAALLAHPEVVKGDASSVNITDPDLAKQYQALKQWLAQRFDSWSTAPAEVVPPTVRQTMKAFSDAMTR